MKTTLLALTGVACLATSGIAMVAADRGTTSSGAETSRGETRATSSMDLNERDSFHVRQVAAGVEFIDISKKGFLSVNELSGYTTSSPANQRNRNNDENDAKLESFDQHGDATDEFRQTWSLR